VNPKLEQLLAYLDREGVLEVVVCVGRPVAVRTPDGYKNLGSTPVTRPQLETLVQGTQLQDIVGQAASQPTEVALGRRRLRAEAVKRGEELMLRIEPSSTLPPPMGNARFGGSVPLSGPSATTVAIPVIRDLPSAQTTPIPVVVETTSELPALARPQVESSLIDERVDVSAMAAIVRAARQSAATDLHLAAGRMVMIRRMGEIVPLDPSLIPPPVPPGLMAALSKPLSAPVTEGFLLPLLGPTRRTLLVNKGYVDLALDVPGGGRLRGNVSRHQGGLRGAFRLAATVPPTLEQVGLPKDLAKVTTHHQGLVVIAGPNGHGKTTTLAALVDLINSSKPFHIITIEDPVEIEHPRKMSVVTQREIGRHTTSFVAALKASLREDPDVIVVGELRDRETVEIALTASETGHLVLATMSTPSAAKTIDRLIDMFPSDQQNQARASIAGALKAIIAQRLLPAARGAGVVPAIELVTGVLPLVTLIRDDKLFQLPNLMQRGRAFGMVRFEESVLELLRAGKITEEVARQYTPSAAKPPPQAQTQAMGRVGRKEPT